MISLNKLKKVVRARKRVGRGISGGQGKTSGRGTKGQKSRSGNTIPTGFEGGQTPLKQRLPKIRGFHRHKNVKAINISLDQIAENYKIGESVTVGTLKEKKLIKNKLVKFKIVVSSKFSAKGRSATRLISPKSSGGKIVASGVFKSKLEFKFVPMSKTAEDIAIKAGAKIISKRSERSENLSSLPSERADKGASSFIKKKK